MPFDWDTARGKRQRTPLQAMTLMFHGGVSDTCVAAALSEEFGYHVSRSSVIGRRHRLGLTDAERQCGPLSGSSPFSPRRRAAKPKAERSKPGPANGTPYVSAKMVSERAERVQAGEMRRDFSLDYVTEGTGFSCEPVALLDLQYGDCRWPMDAGGACGNPAVYKQSGKELSPYCKHHYAASYKETPPRRTSGDPVWIDRRRIRVMG